MRCPGSSISKAVCAYLVVQGSGPVEGGNISNSKRGSIIHILSYSTTAEPPLYCNWSVSKKNINAYSIAFYFSAYHGPDMTKILKKIT